MLNNVTISKSATTARLGIFTWRHRHANLLRILAAIVGIIFATLTFTGRIAWQVQPLLDLRFNTSSFRLAAPSSQNIALCFVGNARTLRLNVTFENLVHHVVQPLREHHNTSIFFIVSLDDAQRPALTRGISDHNATLAALEHFSPTEVRFVTPHDGELASSRVRRLGHPRYEWMGAPDKCDTEVMTRVPHTLYRAQQCVEMIAAHERATKRKFDWVYRLRPDVVFFSHIPLPHTMRRDMYYSNQANTSVTNRTGAYFVAKQLGRGGGAVADQIAMSSREIADVALHAYNAVDDCELYDMGFTPSTEDVLRFWLIKNRVSYTAVPMDWAVLREHRGPECNRLYFQHGVSLDGKRVDWKDSMRLCLKFCLAHQGLFPRLMNARKDLLMLERKVRPDSHIETI